MADAAAGAPGPYFGVWLQVELYLLVNKAGLSPVEALRATTSTTSDLFSWNDRGRIAKGLKADLLLVKGGPLTKITDLLNIKGIWRMEFNSRGMKGMPSNMNELDLVEVELPSGSKSS